MLQQPHMCVPIWLCRVGPMEPHCQGFTHHNLLPTSPPPFSLLKYLSTWLNPRGLELSVQEQCKQFACCSLPCTVQWHCSLSQRDAFVNNKRTHAMVLTEHYNASSCKNSEMVYSRSHIFLFLILFSISSWTSWLLSEVFGFFKTGRFTTKPHDCDCRTV